MVASATPSFPTLLALMRGGRRFLAWWQGELAALVPQRLRLWWRGTSHIALVTLRGGEAVFSRPAEGGCTELFAIEIADKGAALLGSSVRQQLARAMGRDYRLFCTLPADRVLLRTLSLPVAVAENLRQTLGFELDRYTPFRQDQAYFDYRLGHGAPGQASLNVELAVVPRSVVDQQLARLASLGLDIGGAVLADDFREAGAGFRNFLPAAAAVQKPSVRLKQRLAFAAVATALLLALLAIPVWQKRMAAIALIAPVAEARAAAQEVDALRDTVNKLVEEHDFVPNRKWEAHSVTRALEELTRLLPDDTYVVQFEFDGKGVQLLGETGSSSGMVEAIEASPLFRDVAFRSPLTKIQGTPFDRFQIGAVLEGAGKPPAQAAAPVAAAAPATEEGKP